MDAATRWVVRERYLASGRFPWRFRRALATGPWTSTGKVLVPPVRIITIALAQP